MATPAPISIPSNSAATNTTPATIKPIATSATTATATATATATTSAPTSGASGSVNAVSSLVGPYVVGETLGSGAFGFVKIAAHHTTGERVAIKFLKKDRKHIEASTKQASSEVNALTKLSHRNVITCKGLDWNAKFTTKDGAVLDVIAIVLELAAGGELFEFLAFSGCFEEVIARTYFHQLMAGVTHCHANGLAHRDLKPDNLLLDSNFNLKVADFGTSILTAAAGFGIHTITYTDCGTRGYVAPEIKSNKGYDPMKADIWSCGVILFALLSAKAPFKDANEKKDWFYHKLFTNQHSLFWNVHCKALYFSDDAKDLLNKMLQPDPNKRATLQTIMKHRWFTNGQTLSEKALRIELERRKQIVDQTKIANAQQQAAEDFAAAAVAAAAAAAAANDRKAQPFVPRPVANGNATAAGMMNANGELTPTGAGGHRGVDTGAPNDGTNAAAGSGAGAGTPSLTHATGSSDVPPPISSDGWNELPTFNFVRSASLQPGIALPPLSSPPLVASTKQVLTSTAFFGAGANDNPFAAAAAGTLLPPPMSPTQRQQSADGVMSPNSAASGGPPTPLNSLAGVTSLHAPTPFPTNNSNQLGMAAPIAAASGAGRRKGSAPTSAAIAADVKKATSEPPAFDPTANVQCYTRFESREAASAVLTRLKSLVGDGLQGKFTHSDPYRLKCSVVTPSGLLVFVIQLFRTQLTDAKGSSNGVAVEFRRREGDALQFRSLFKHIRDSAADIVFVPPAPPAVAAAGDHKSAN